VQITEKYPSTEVIFRFIGATPESSNGRALLESLCHQSSKTYEADESGIPTDYIKLIKEFQKQLTMATISKPLIIYLDALDQLSNANNARNLVWLPANLPENVRMVVSTLPGECYEALKRKIPEENLLKLRPMQPKEGEELLDLWLKDAKRAMQAHQRKEVLEKFQLNGLPLYLKLAFEEARRWKSYSEIIKLSPDIGGVIKDLFKRLSLDENHGEMMVSRSLGYLAASKNGLSEDELIDVLSEDKEVFGDFKKRTYHEPPEPRLPVVIWSRLYFDLEPYLSERKADGTSLITFYHPTSFGNEVHQKYLSGEMKLQLHKCIAEYFTKQPLYTERDNKINSNLRKLAELPYQQTMGEIWEELYSTLTDFHFLEQKAVNVGVMETKDIDGNTKKIYTGIFEIIKDLDFALEKMPGKQNGNKQGQHPIIVTAKEYQKGLIIYCPFCNTSSPLNNDWLGEEIMCLNKDCNISLRVNPFVVKKSI
jgi:NACHT domain- and WD repeat-containing protein